MKNFSGYMTMLTLLMIENPDIYNVNTDNNKRLNDNNTYKPKIKINKKQMKKSRSKSK